MSLKEAEKRLSERTCRFVDFIDSLDKSDKETIAKWFEERKLVGWIARVATADGKRTNDKTLGSHLKGQCHCPAGTEFKGLYVV